MVDKNKFSQYIINDYFRLYSQYHRNNETDHLNLLLPYDKLITCGEISDYSCLMPKQILQVSKAFQFFIEKIIKNENEDDNNNNNKLQIIDCTAHIGCDTLLFYLLSSQKTNINIKVIGVEKNKKAFECLNENIKIANAINIELINENILNVIDKIGNKNSILYLDPPWGGRNYLDENKNNTSINLFLDKSDNNGDVLDIINFIDNAFQKEKCGSVIVKIPINYNITNFDKYSNQQNIFYCRLISIKKDIPTKKGNIYFYLLFIMKKKNNIS
jgi:predicted RNA methylase